MITDYYLFNSVDGLQKCAILERQHLCYPFQVSAFLIAELRAQRTEELQLGMR